MDKHYGSFVWDLGKEAMNVLKHGVDFTGAAEAFSDPERKIFDDARHGRGEKRYFCLGQSGGRVMTVRFTYRDDKVRIIGAGYWRKGERYYEEKKIR